MNYYSPLEFYKPEVFVGSELKDQKTGISASLEAAGSYQFVDGMTQPNFRSQATLSKETGSFTFSVSGTYTTIAAVQAAGFSYAELKGQITWQFMSRPLFNSSRL